MTVYLIVLILFMCLCIAFGALLAFNIMMRIIMKSNMASECKSNFYYNSKQPMRMHIFTLMERLVDAQENPEYYKKAE